jgi:hypothetical protein
LLQLSPECKGPESAGEHCDDAHTQLDTVEKANSEVREASSLTETIGTKEEDEICRSQIEVNMLQTQEGCEQDT